MNHKPATGAAGTFDSHHSGRLAGARQEAMRVPRDARAETENHPSLSPLGTACIRTLPLISIVIHNFNYGRFLAHCIDSALAQSYPHCEVIVVDDASTDGSRAVLERYADRVRIVYQAANRGQGGAFNAGFRASRGSIVMFLDATTGCIRVPQRASPRPAAGIVENSLPVAPRQ